jgi:Secretion system C-terminal sorting domain
MKKNLLHFAFTIASLLGFQTASAQVCVVDPQYTAPGIYPSDTLQDMYVNTPTLQVIQFVFPADTVIFGQTIPFDSFAVASVSNIPVGVQWECNLNHPTCSYVTTPGQLTRGCVKVFGTPTSGSAAFPSYDSLIVTGTAFFTVFGIPQSLNTDISVFYRVSTGASIDDLAKSVKLDVRPNPATEQTYASFSLPAGGDVKVSLYNVLGEEVRVLSEGVMGAGEKSVRVNTAGLGEGIYFLRLDLNNGEYVGTKKVVSLR